MSRKTDAQFEELAKRIEALGDNYQQLRGSLDAAEGARKEEIRQLRHEINSLRQQQAPPSRSGRGGRAEQEQDDEEFNKHVALLDIAAGVAYVKISCHRDTWDFLITEAARTEHFRLPAVVKEDHNLVEAKISGRSLVAILEALRATQNKPSDEARAGTRRLAVQTYQRIGKALEQISKGEDRTASIDEKRPPVTRIVIDDRPAGA